MFAPTSDATLTREGTPLPSSRPPSDPADQLQWLVDRAAISDLLIEFARTLDDREWQNYAANYAPDGTLSFNGHLAHQGREGLAAFVEAGLGQYAGTHHVSANHAITIEGDVATTRSYLIAGHVFNESEPHRHADGAGWYRCKLRRTDSGWQFTEVLVEIKYLSGEPITH